MSVEIRISGINGKGYDRRSGALGVKRTLFAQAVFLLQDAYSEEFNSLKTQDCEL